MFSGLRTIGDFEIWANTARIPMLLDVNEAEHTIDIAYFKRDEEAVRSKFHEALPIGIYANHFVIPDRIGVTQQELLTYMEEQ